MKSVIRWVARVLVMAVVCLVGHGPGGKPQVGITEAQAGGSCPAIDVRPNFMIIFDTSGSMTSTLDGECSSIACSTAGGQCGASGTCTNFGQGTFQCTCTADNQCPSGSFCHNPGSGRTALCVRDCTVGDGSFDQPGRTAF